MKNKTSSAVAFVLSIAMMAFISKPTPKFKELPADVIISWNLISHETMDGKNYQPMLASRVNTMVHIAMHDALNAIDPVYVSYALKERDRKADPEAAAATAAYTVLVASFPEKKEMLNAKLAEWLSRVKNPEAKNRAILLGDKAGRKIVELRKKDGALDGVWAAPWQASVRPGIYQLVPPLNFVYAPHWKTMKTFSLNRYDQFRIAPPPALTSNEYAASFNEVKLFGGKNSTLRTADQTFYAKFWYELSEIGWNRIGRVVTADKKLNLFDAARLFALLNMALADAYTAGWDSKFHYNFWRPYTAIQFADTDDNPATARDENWESQEVTPPVQDYPSTHSALGNAAATVLAGILGDKTRFTFTSPSADPKNASRTFNSFSQAADENADSRVMAGIHFRFSCRAGQDLGNKVGQWTLENQLKPLQ
ncbi:MAG TPA: vanadium-dependent haloperoxidase [Chitinophagaceae bacterium]|nr:vanadium-dependent haloperoxidase [Chitinophagaceae bacterium]